MLKNYFILLSEAQNTCPYTVVWLFYVEVPGEVKLSDK